MDEDAKTYRPNDLAKIYGVHANTVRLYERIGFLTPAERGKNNYRRYSELQLQQLKLCRCIFSFPFTTRRIRNAGNQLLLASGAKQWEAAEKYAKEYLKIVTAEYQLALKTAEHLNSWIHVGRIGDKSLKETYSRAEIAEKYNLTVETVRNWERNNLISSLKSGRKQQARYSTSQIDRISIIYMLRQAGYSMAAIHQSLQSYDKGKINEVLPALHGSKIAEIISVGDHWCSELAKLVAAAKRIPLILQDLTKV